MTHWNRPRGLNSDQRTTTATRLRAIADQLDADHAAAVQANLEAWADPTPWPAATGGTGTGTSPTSPVEHAIGITRDTDTPTLPLPLAAPQAMRLIAALHQMARLAKTVDDGLSSANPKRKIAYCPNPKCGRAVLPGERCPVCSTREQAKPTCDDCKREADKLLPWPPSTWAGWTDGEQRRVCMADYKWRRRHDGRAKVSIEALALGDGMIEQAG